LTTVPFREEKNPGGDASADAELWRDKAPLRHPLSSLSGDAMFPGALAHERATVSKNRSQKILARADI
jgi:hypothetical protein